MSETNSSQHSSCRHGCESSYRACASSREHESVCRMKRAQCSCSCSG